MLIRQSGSVYGVTNEIFNIREVFEFVLGEANWRDKRFKRCQRRLFCLSGWLPFIDDCSLLSKRITAKRNQIISFLVFELVSDRKNDWQAHPTNHIAIMAPFQLKQHRVALPPKSLEIPQRNKLTSINHPVNLIYDDMPINLANNIDADIKTWPEFRCR